MSEDTDTAGWLTTAQLAERTGVPAPTLRMWESRHGFPVPARRAGGHRRYRERDVELVRRVLGRREEGLSLAAAIERTLGEERATPVSIFAGVRQRREDLPTMSLRKPALLALSRAIEDEHCARGSGGVLVGSFQTARFFRQSERRWRELTRTARLAVAMADFRRLRRSPGRPVEVPVGRDHPLAREWAIVFHAPGSSACLVGWEIPQATAPANRERSFEVLWSPEPEVAELAIRLAASLVAPLAPAVGRWLRAAVEDPTPPSTPELRAAVSQAHRMLSYLGGQGQ